jgi:hypothetical protein
MKKYFNFLNKIQSEFFIIKRPLSLEILKNKLSTKFNLSPDYCVQIIKMWLRKKEN